MPAATATTSLKAPITIETALALAPMQRGDPVVRSGRDSLDRIIRWVHAAEVPNIAQLLQGGELLLTTGMGLGKREHEQRRFIRGLAEREIAGLVIELGQAFQDIPQCFVNEAERHGLPLIALRQEVAFVQVTEAIHREILQRQYAYLEHGTEVYDRFAQIVLDGGDLAEVMRALSQAIRNPVLLENEHRELLCHAEFRVPESEVLASWRTQGGEPSLSTAGGAYVLPVPMGGRAAHGRLIAMPCDGPISDLDRVVLERVVWLLGLTLLRTNQEEELSLRTRGNFLLDLAEGRIGEEDAEAEARSLGFDHHGLLVPAVIRVTDPVPVASVSRLVEIGNNVRNELEARRLRTVVGIRPSTSEILLVMATPSSEDRLRIAEQLATIARTIVERKIRGARPVVAVAGAAGWAEMPNAVREATEAADAADHLEPRLWHDATEADMERLLWQLRANPALRSFVNQQLGPLLEHDRGHKNKPLLPTLEALCRQGGNKAETARELFLARQALYNRLQRINDILGFDTSSPEHFPAANLAVRAARFIPRDST